MGRKDMMRTTMIAAVCAAIGTAGGIAGVSAATERQRQLRQLQSATRRPLRTRAPVKAGIRARAAMSDRTESSEELLTGDVAAKVRQAALDKVGGGTVERVETDADHGSPYEAHIRRSDGTELEVLVNKDFSVTAVNEMGAPH